MTNRQQSAFFLSIVFLFTSGIGLVIYRQYDLYYQQKAAIDLEAASTAIPAKKLSVSTTPNNISDWKTYKNTEYGFEFQIPNNELVVDNNFVYDPAKASWPGIGINFIEFDKLPKTIEDACKEVSGGGSNCTGNRDPAQTEYIELAQAFSEKDSVYIQKNFMSGYTINFMSDGIFIYGHNQQAGDYEVEFDIFDKNNNLIRTFPISPPTYSGLESLKNSENYKIIQNIAKTFKFIK